MDILESLVEEMSPVDKGLFRYFLQAEKSDRRDLQLFEMMVMHPEWSAERLTKRLYRTDNRNAYHSLRKRLMVQMMDFIALRQARSNLPDQQERRWLAMAVYLLERGHADKAERFLMKAQLLAESRRDYRLLDELYLLRIRWINALSGRLSDWVAPWQKNRERLEEVERLTLASALVKERLSIARKSGDMLDLEATVREVFSQVKLTSEMANDAAYMLELCTVIRSAVISTKNYHRFEPFVSRIYRRLERSGAFITAGATVQRGFLYIVVHVMYRNKKFGEAEQWVDRLRSLSVTPAEKARSILLHAAILSYSGRNKEAAEMVQASLTDKKTRYSIEDTLNMKLNLCVYLFQSEAYRKSNKVLLDMGHTDAWLEKKMGKEWRFKKSMIELIVQFELGNTEISLQRLRALEKYFSGFLQHPSYHRASVFMRFIKQLILHPERVTTAAFQTEVEMANMGLPGDQEDIQAITFFQWLHSKMLRRPYYEVLMEAISEK